MSRRATGIMFLTLATLLFATRYVAAALYAPAIGPWGEAEFQRYLSYVGALPLQLAGIALVIGVSYLVWAEYEAITKPAHRPAPYLPEGRA